MYTFNRRLYYEEQTPALQIEWDNGVYRVTRRIRFRLAQADVLVDLIGYEYATGDGKIYRVNPEPYAGEFPATLATFPVTLTAGPLVNAAASPLYHVGYRFVQGLDHREVPGGGPAPGGVRSANTVMVYDSYIFDVFLASLPYRLAPDWLVERGPPANPDGGELCRNVVRTQEYAAESLAYGPGMFKYEGTPQPIPEPPPRIFSTSALTYKWVNVPAGRSRFNRLDQRLRDGVIGKVNDAAFDAEAYPATTLLIVGAERSEYRVNLHGESICDYTYKFLLRNNGAGSPSGQAGWNHLPRVDGTFHRVTIGGAAASATNTLYQTYDFGKLFRLTA